MEPRCEVCGNSSDSRFACDNCGEYYCSDKCKGEKTDFHKTRCNRISPETAMDFTNFFFGGERARVVKVGGFDVVFLAGPTAPPIPKTLYSVTDKLVKHMLIDSDVDLKKRPDVCYVARFDDLPRIFLSQLDENQAGLILAKMQVSK